jgi:protein gp37
MTPNLDWLLLTKRPENIAGMLPPDWGEGYPNAWLGTTVEDERVAHRIDALRAVPAAVRFLSVEPMIGPLELRGRLDGIGWVIVGGESGAKARPMALRWARNVRGACVEAGVAFHFKQWGTWAPHVHTGRGERFLDGDFYGRGTKELTGRELDGRTWDEFPEASHAIA